METEEPIEQIPNQEFAQWKFLALQNDEITPPQQKQQLIQKLIDAVQTHNMVPFYLSLVEDLKIPKDNALVEKLTKANEDKVKQLDDAIKDAIENLGESEVRDAMQAKADFYAKIGDKTQAESQYRLTIEKTVGSGQKLDIVFTLIRIGLFWNDHDLITRNLEKAKSMVEAGSDWDRKNRLKVYEAIYLMSVRNFKRAAHLLLEGISTFTAVELLDYPTFIWYSVLMSVVALDRVTLKNKVLNAPEILQVIDQFSYLRVLMNSLYNSDYGNFFKALAETTEAMKRNRFVAAHAGFYCKELRILAYAQMLESYKSVNLNSMAHAFGVSPDFLDREISRFIASGRLHCKIDKVGGIIETNRADSKNAQYQATIKQGDLLLNRIQKLSRVINL